MARRPTTSQSRRFRALIAKLEPELAEAFLAAVADLRAGVDFAAMLRALERGDIEAAIAAANIDRAAFTALGQAQAAAYAEAGAVAVTTIALPGVAVSIRFDMRDPVAERYVREVIWGHLDDWTTADQINAIRETISTGFDAGRNPRDIARDVAGRVVGGRRQGGVIGLDSGRAHRFSMVSRGMETAEGVQSLVIRRNDGSLGLRYKVNAATEKAILAAYRRGEAVPEATRIRSQNQFYNALLKSRSDTIAQDGSAQAVFGAREEAWRQVLDKRGYPPEAVLKTWRHGGGPEEPRPHHLAMSGTTVRGLYTPFVFSNGATLRWPHDTMGAAAETIRCTCGADFRLDPRWGME